MSEKKSIFRAFDFSDYDGAVRVRLDLNPTKNEGLLHVEVVEGNGWIVTHDYPLYPDDFSA